MSDEGYKPRRGPEDTQFAWNDADGTHTGRTDADGIFTPKNASEEAHMVSLGWPHARTKKADEQPVVPAEAAKE